MAKPIPLTLPPRDPRRELMTRLEAAPAEHAAALLDGYELLQKMHEQGVFKMIRGALGATDKIVEAVAEGANSNESIRGLRNTIILAKMLGSIDPEVLQGIANATAETLGETKASSDNPPGLFSLLLRFRGKNQRRAIALVERLLNNVGLKLKRNDM